VSNRNFFAELKRCKGTTSRSPGRGPIEMSAEEQRKLAAIMFTDMVGYSALSQRDKKLARELL